MEQATGTTLIELLLALCLLGILAGLAAPALEHGVDVVAARAARDELAAAVSRTRSSAVALGGASLIVDPGHATFWIRGAAGDTVLQPVDLFQRHGVDLAASGADGTVELSFDALGIGRMTSRTIRLVRGTAVANVTVSAYGRARTW